MIAQPNFRNTCFSLPFSSPMPIVLLKYLFRNQVKLCQVIDDITQGQCHNSISHKSSHVRKWNVRSKSIFKYIFRQNKGHTVIQYVCIPRVR